MRRSTLAEQTAAHLCEVIRAGRWTNKLPGVRALAAECDVSAGTMRAALALLEAEHRITADGAGRCRRVAGGASKPGNAGRSLRVMVLLDVSWDAIDAGFLGFLFQLQRALEEAGHFCGFANKSQAELKNDLGRISRYVAKTPADAWLVAGGNAETLIWFAGRKVPALAVGGRCMDVPIASTDLSFEMAFRAGVRRLIELGHRRILLLGPRFMIHPEPALPIRGLLEELTACGVTPSHNNLPDWEETPAGLQAQLDGSFRYTPPTAIIVTSAILILVENDLAHFDGFRDWFSGPTAHPMAALGNAQGHAPS